MASLTRWMWVWVNSGSWRWTGRPGVLRFMASQRVGNDWVTELNWMGHWSERKVAQLCLTLHNPMDYSLPGSSVHGIIQARILDWVAVPFSRAIFPTQRLNPSLLNCRWILYCLSHQGNALFYIGKGFLFFVFFLINWTKADAVGMRTSSLKPSCLLPLSNVNGTSVDYCLLVIQIHFFYLVIYRWFPWKKKGLEPSSGSFTYLFNSKSSSCPSQHEIGQQRQPG